MKNFKKIAGVTSLLVFVSMGMTMCATKKEATTTIRIGTYNIAAKNNPDVSEMTKVFNENNLDIVGFQEVDMFNGRNNYDMMEAFKDDTYKYVDFARGRDFSDGYFGVGFISKYDFIEKEFAPIESTGGKATKTCERVLIEKEGNKIAVYNTHLSYESLQLRRRQIKEIIDIVNADPTEYKVITGDFNTDQNMYEYSMFLDNFNIANGNDGEWFDTFNDVDPDMRVFTIDNVIATKNMKILSKNMVENKLSDHNLFFAEFELLDEYVGEVNSGNIALGQEVIASSTSNDSSPYDLVDYFNDTEWKSGNSNNQETIIIKLDKVYDVDKVKILWGENRASNYEVLASEDGIDYKKVYEYTGDASQNEDDFNVNLGRYKFLKFELLEKKEVAEFYSIKEVSIFGNEVKNEIKADELVKNGEFETEISNSDWKFKTEVNDEIFKVSLDEKEKQSGAKSIIISKSEDVEKATCVLIQENIEVKANRRYKLSFDVKTDTLKSGAFGIEIAQKDKSGESVPEFQTTLNDNFNINSEWRNIEYNFVTSEVTDMLDLKLKVLNGIGNLWIDNVSIIEIQ